MTGDDSQPDFGYGMHSKNDLLKNRQSHSPCVVKIPDAQARPDPSWMKAFWVQHPPQPTLAAPHQPLNECKGHRLPLAPIRIVESRTDK